MKKTNLFLKKGYSMNIIAGVMIACLLLVDASLFKSLDSQYSSGDNENSDIMFSNDEYEIIENHVLDNVLADGKWEGRGSDYEDPSEAKHGYKVREEIKDSKYGIVNILEIVPDQRMGFVGYTIGGCEPLGETSEEREWIMDAMANDETGSDEYLSQNPYFIDDIEALVDPDLPALTYERGKYTGYFKKVANGHGMYKLDGVEYSGDNVSNVVMTSRFKNNGSPVSQSADGFDYVWIESEKDSEGNYTQKGKYTTKAELESGEPIYLYEYKKIKCLNNEEFLSFIYPAEVKDSNGTIYRVDGKEGIYHTGDNCVMISENSKNKKVVEMYKNAKDSKGNRGIKVFTRTPAQLQKEEDLIDNVDLIIIASHVDSEYVDAYDTYNIAYKGIVPDSDLRNKGQYTLDTNDLTFEQVMKIYKRVVVKQNVAIACSQLCLTEISNPGEMNIWKLMFMLYLFNSKDNNETGVSGSGRRFIMDFMETYKDSAPTIARVRGDINSNESFKDIKASDIVCINEETGKFIVKEDYNNWFYEKIQDIDGPDYVKWRFRSSDISSSGMKWPTSIKDNWLLAWTEGDVYSKENNQFKYSGYNNTSFPLYKYYLYVYNEYYHGNDNEKGLYIHTYSPSFDGSYSKYMNQMMYKTSGRLFSIKNGGAELIKSIIKNMSEKVIPEPSEGSSHTEEVEKTAYMTMNIYNGDGVNKKIGGNKVIYFNDYEVLQDKIDKIDIDFEIRTTHPIEGMELYIEPGHKTIANYTFTTTNSDALGNTAPTELQYVIKDKDGNKLGTGKGKLTKTVAGAGESNPDKKVVDDPVWKYSGQVEELTKEYFKSSRNTNVRLRVYSNLDVAGGKKLESVDSITLVRRDFFMLN